MRSSVPTRPSLARSGSATTAQGPDCPPSHAQAVTATRDGAIFAAGTLIGIGIIGAMAVGSGQLTLITSLVAIAAGVVAPPVGLVVLAILAPLRSPLVIPAPGFNTLLVAAILLGCVYRLPIDRPRLVVSSPLLLVVAIFVYVFAQQVPEMLSGWQGEVGHLVGYLFFQVVTGVGTLVATAMIVNGRPPWPYLVALLASATFAATLALLTFTDQGLAAMVSNLVGQSEDASRAVGPFGNPNYLGQFMACALVLGVALLSSSRRGIQQTVLLAQIVVIGAGLAVSLSRGGAIAAFAGLLAWGFARGRRTGLIVLAVGLPIAIVAYELLLNQRIGSGARVAGAGADAALAASSQGRLDAGLEGPALFATNPIFGIGFGRFSFESSSGLAAHNWYSSILAELGLIGIVLWGLLLIAISAGLRSRERMARATGFGMLSAVVFGSLFLEMPESFQTSVLPAMVITAALAADWSRLGRQAVESTVGVKPTRRPMRPSLTGAS